MTKHAPTADGTDALRRVGRQLLDLFRTMSPVQRATTVAFPLLVAAGLAALVWGRSESYVALSWGKQFPDEERKQAEDALAKAGLTDFRRDGRRLLVPQKHAERYNAVLLEAGELGFGTELERQIEQVGLFGGGPQTQARRDVALAKELRRVICAVPEIDDASVIWARSHQRRWSSRRSPVTATVNVRPGSDRKLSLTLAHSLRAAVANMVPDLAAEDVTVFNQAEGRAYTDADFGSRLHAESLRRDYTERISQALSYIPGVRVNVNVDDAPPDPQPAVHVAIVIPQDYLATAAIRATGSPEPVATELSRIRQSVERNVKSTVFKVIPPGSPDSAVSVSSYIPVDSNATQPDSTNSPALRYGRWTMPVGLALFLIVGTVGYRRRAGRQTESTILDTGSQRDVPDKAVTSSSPRGGPPPVRPPSGGPFAFLQELSPTELSGLLEDEHPQTVALITRELPAEFSSSLLARFPADRRDDVVLRMPHVQKTDPAVIEELVATLKEQLAGMSPSRLSSFRSTTGPAATQVFEESAQSTFSFDDLRRLDRTSVRILWQHTERIQWAVALKWASEQVKAHVLKHLDDRAGDHLKTEIARLGPVKISDVESCQYQIVAAHQRLQAAGLTSAGRTDELQYIA